MEELSVDEIARFNKDRWEELAKANVQFSRPLLGLDSSQARKLIDPHGYVGDVAGKDVLCLASGGGQQSAAFGLLGANVTVLDLSETQLKRDRETAEHHGISIRTEQGDMRDLSRFADRSFDVVYHPWSISFVPDVANVLSEVGRVSRSGGIYYLGCANPFTIAVDDEGLDEECEVRCRGRDLDRDGHPALTGDVRSARGR